MAKNRRPILTITVLMCSSFAIHRTKNITYYTLLAVIKYYKAYTL